MTTFQLFLSVGSG